MLLLFRSRSFIAPVFIILLGFVARPSLAQTVQRLQTDAAAERQEFPAQSVQFTVARQAYYYAGYDYYVDLVGQIPLPALHVSELRGRKVTVTIDSIKFYGCYECTKPMDDARHFEYALQVRSLDGRWDVVPKILSLPDHSRLSLQSSLSRDAVRIWLSYNVEGLVTEVNIQKNGYENFSWVAKATSRLLP